MKKLPAAMEHCQKISGALRRRLVSVIAISFDLCTPSLMGSRWDLQCDEAHTGLLFIAVPADEVIEWIANVRNGP
jgi:hypothetical protein